MPLLKPPATIKLSNSESGGVVCHRCLLADNFWTRGKGLLGRSGLAEDEGILLVPGSSIHMVGMKFAIDVIYLTKEDVVTDFVEDIQPGKMHFAKGKAGKPYSALEMASGSVARFGVKVGDKLRREVVGELAPT